MGEQQLAKPAARSRKDVLPLLPMPLSSIARSVCWQLHNRQICSTQICPAGFPWRTRRLQVCVFPRVPLPGGWPVLMALCRKAMDCAGAHL